MNKQGFEVYGIDKLILESLNKLGYKNPTKVQDEVIPLILEDKDVIVRSQTGTGKTASFGIPVCEKIDIEEREPQALILTPTRELCVQIKEDINNIGRLKRVRCAAIFGKQPVEVQLRELRQRVHVIAGTPGRTMDLIDRGKLAVDKIKYLVIDEADKMLNMGFIEQVEAIIQKMPHQRVTMLFSATMPEEIISLCTRYMKTAYNIEIAPENIAAEKIQQVWYEVDTNDKFDLLKKIIYIENPESCIIFCNTKEAVGNLGRQMKDRDFSCNTLHGGMLQDERLEVMQKFKRGEFNFLVATDVAARGIDVSSLSHIINYEVPEETESYVHRIGRTGRAGNSGKAITFADRRGLRFLRAIEEYIGYQIPKGEIPTQEEVERAKNAYNKKTVRKLKIKEDKGARLNSEITKIYIGAGKKKKIRPGDILGAITSIDGVKAEDVGIIDIQDNFSYTDILNRKGDMVLKALQYVTIKGKNVRTEKAQK